ncbi:DEAD/DEAH box helicase [Corynebacterium choanae]|uniref:DEAD-box ATP-dependent RNA helicase CshA n=1 Tax=Corynebacterium choanae TaxID=1862358 RepID=A0A3G6JAE9_9CORY|nr:DEAD/DEAH box helicase [Corynebacterium choanae]AZA12934.1 DEAD-box ATP-dependent RNA helicase CshA [Corynebacterium choanae]
MPNNSQPTFAELGVAQEIVDALAEQSIVETFAIQQLTLPIALTGQDLIGQARTGMGKTFGFGIPLIDRVFDDADVAELDGTPRALVVVPTRELAIQVGNDLTMAAKYTPLTIVTFFGGRPYEEQTEALAKGVDVIVGTPGRLLDLYKRFDLRLDQVAVLVLDEADEMLDLGFLPDVEKLMEALTHEHQTMLFSATMPPAIIQLARGFMQQPTQIRAEDQGADQVHATTKQVVFQAHKLDKLAVVARVLQAKQRGRTIIFVKTKRSCGYLANDLAELGFRVGMVHGDMDQSAREKSLRGFHQGEFSILIATDVAARGIDIDDVTHVINFEVPLDPMTYVHRIGRTGRAGNSGTAVTLVGLDEVRLWQSINDELQLGIDELPEWFSTSPELHEALQIPQHVQSQVGKPVPVFSGGMPRKSGGKSGVSGKHRSSSRAREGAGQKRGSRRS